MGAFKYITKNFQQSYAQRSDIYRARIQAWRQGNTITRLENPTNPPRAHSLGYRATKEFVIARVRLHKGRFRREATDLGRKHGNTRKHQHPGKERAWFAEEKCGRRFPNLEPINSYWVGEDGQYKYFEVIMHNAQ
ncbi:MAG TPA: hypothetical protein VGQ00_04775 [Candidatus Norongarragalinales archaeon]|jgi:large subunit ribosomal protein L15e|nr:hypothetical protein [Candidatus Norongarragalinales archaeon]